MSHLSISLAAYPPLWLKNWLICYDSAMTNPEIALQRDMFSGELIDNRTRGQKQADEERQEPQQQAMFKLSEVLGTKTVAKPIIETANLASEVLVLIAEDTRSDEEKEADFHRAALARTQAMFAEATDEHPDLNETAAQEQQPQSPQVSAYLELVEVVCQRITTLWIDNNYEQQFHLQLATAILAAQDIGLSLPEISLAIQIGKHLGEQKRLTLDVQPPTLLEQKRAVSSDISPQSVSETSIFEGYRARKRRESVKLRRRSIQQAA